MFREIPKNSKLAEIRDYYLFYAANKSDFNESADTDGNGPQGGYFSGRTKPFAETIGETTLGSGSFSTCISFGTDYVLKFNHRDDPSYRKYVNFCFENKEMPGLPTIYYSEQWADSFVLLLDRLQSVRPFHYGIIDFINNEDDYPDGPENYMQARETFFRIERARKRLNRSTFWAKALKRVGVEKGPYDDGYVHNDLASDNVMLKGDQFIFTDPWS